MKIKRKMKRKIKKDRSYRVVGIGILPEDIRSRISKVHAMALLKANNVNISDKEFLKGSVSNKNVE